MKRGEAPQLTVVPPGEGEYGELEGVGVVFKLSGEQINGSVSIVEHPFAVGVFVEPHVHSREDEYSIVTEGEVGSGLGTGRSCWVRAATTPNHAGSRT